MTNVVWYKILTTLEKTTTSNCIYRVGNEEHKESNELDRESERWRIEGQASRRARLYRHFRQGIRSILFVKHSKSLPLLEAKTGLKLKFHFSLIIAFSWGSPTFFYSFFFLLVLWVPHHFYLTELWPLSNKNRLLVFQHLPGSHMLWKDFLH